MNHNVLLFGAVAMTYGSVAGENWPPELVGAMVLLWMGLAVIVGERK